MRMSPASCCFVCVCIMWRLLKSLTYCLLWFKRPSLLPLLPLRPRQQRHKVVDYEIPNQIKISTCVTINSQ